MCDCPACTAEPLRFYGAPVDGLEIYVPKGMPRVNVPTLLVGGEYLVVVYERYQLATGAAMVSPGVWPPRLARE